MDGFKGSVVSSRKQKSGYGAREPTSCSATPDKAAKTAPGLLAGSEHGRETIVVAARTPRLGPQAKDIASTAAARRSPKKRRGLFRSAQAATHRHDGDRSRAR